jgi:hypothetical protein
MKARTANDEAGAAERRGSGGPLKGALQHLGGFAVAAFFVFLLSFTFSFLGTIFCAAVGGMMLGAVRGYRWQSIPVSLLFPGVILVLLKGMRTELGDRQVLLVALACFGIFWLTYGVAAALFVVEGRGKAPSARPAGKETGRQVGRGAGSSACGNWRGAGWRRGFLAGNRRGYGWRSGRRS